MSATWDVVIAGAGPAGALAARQLALRGLAVLLVEKSSFPRDKVCGTCLNRHALTVLDEVGLGNLIETHGGVALTGFDVRGWGRSAQLRLPAGRSLSRPVFDAALVDAAVAAGATFQSRTRVALGSLETTHRNIILTPVDERIGETVTARIVIDATGLGGLDANEFQETIADNARIGLGATSEDAGAFATGVIHMAIGNGGYVGLVIQEDGRLNMAAAIAPGWMREQHGPAAAIRSILEDARFPVPSDLDTIAWQGTPKLTRSVSRCATDRLFRLGDAAGYVEPFTGEGMAWALCGAAALAPIIANSIVEWRPDAILQWQCTHERIIARRQRLCRWLAATLKRPRFAKWMIVGLHAFPTLARPFVRQLNAPPRFSIEASA